MAPTKVLFVVSAGRSGSTLLGSLLGQMPGVFNGGEMRMIWHRSLLENRACGCGLPFDACETWQGILEEGFGGVSTDAARHYYSASRQFTRMRYFPMMALPPSRRRTIENSREYLEVLQRLYQATASYTGASLIVDTTKVPPYGRALQEMDGLDVYVVHLVRDSRAVAHSWSRRKLHPDSGLPMGAKGLGAGQPVTAGFMWAMWNVAAEVVMDTQSSYMRLGYEQLIRDPMGTFDTIGRFVGEGAIGGDGLEIDGDTVQMRPTHTVFGNPSRFDVGTVQLRVDDAWMRKLSSPARLSVTLATAPLLYRYRDSI